jgi:hypothetical protein
MKRINKKQNIFCEFSGFRGSGLSSPFFWEMVPRNWKIWDPSKGVELSHKGEKLRTYFGRSYAISRPEQRSPYSDTLRAGRSPNLIQAGGEVFCAVQIGPETYPASCTMDTGVFPGVKRPECGADHPSLCNRRVANGWSYTPRSPNPLCLQRHVMGVTFTYIRSSVCDLHLEADRCSMTAPQASWHILYLQSASFHTFLSMAPKMVRRRHPSSGTTLRRKNQKVWGQENEVAKWLDRLCWFMSAESSAKSRLNCNVKIRRLE